MHPEFLRFWTWPYQANILARNIFRSFRSFKSIRKQVATCTECWLLVTTSAEYWVPCTECFVLSADFLSLRVELFVTSSHVLSCPITSYLSYLSLSISQPKTVFKRRTCGSTKSRTVRGAVTKLSTESWSQSCLQGTQLNMFLCFCWNVSYRDNLAVVCQQFSPSECCPGRCE